MRDMRKCILLPALSQPTAKVVHIAGVDPVVVGKHEKVIKRVQIH